jgi:hypothetical protein
MGDDDGESATDTWISWFCSQRGNEFFCEVDATFVGASGRAVGRRAAAHAPAPALRDSILARFPTNSFFPLLFCAPHPLLLPSAEDAFNLYGLRTAVSNFKECIEIILDVAPRSGASKS